MTAAQLQRRNARYTPLDVDGPLPIDMLRAVPAIRRDPLSYLASMIERFGDLVAFPMPRTPAVLVNDPAGARRVLQDNSRGYTKQTVQYGSLSLVTGRGLLTADADEWRRRRRIAQPAFHHSALDGVAAQAVDAAERVRSAADDAASGGSMAGVSVGGGSGSGQWVDMDATVMHAMLEVVGHTLFDDDLAGVGHRVVNAVDDALHVVVQRAQSPLSIGPLQRLPSPSRRRLGRAVRTLDAACFDLMARRRASGVRDDDTDLLGLLLRSGRHQGGLSDREIRDELVTMIIAGHETVASCLTWTLHLLSGSPAVQRRLHTELDDVLAGRAPRWTDLPHLPYARAVVDEALRLYPPAWIITRRAVSQDVVAGLAIPAGTLVLISPWLMQRRPQAWADPDRFDPDRFLARHRSSGPESMADGYLPFGAGARLCIGRDFALVEAVLVLAALLRDRTVAAPAGVPTPRVDALVTLRPRGGLPLSLRHRRPGGAHDPLPT